MAEATHRRGGDAYCEGVALAAIAEAVGTPAYIYSGAALDAACGEWKRAFAGYPTLGCYAVKANHNTAVLRRIFGHGFGADIVSGGELARALRAGARPRETVFSGVGKTAAEIEQGLEAGVLAFNVESAGELEMIAQRAEARESSAKVCLRINPDIDARTNPHLTTGRLSAKFGIGEEELQPLVAAYRERRGVTIAGLACHIGSQITDADPFREAARRMSALARELLATGLPLEMLDLGGGLGIRYRDETPPGVDEYARILIEEARTTGLRLLIEPGRGLMGAAGVLLTRVIGVKHGSQKTFVLVDAAMNDLIRPSLYDAYHEIAPVRMTAGAEPVTVDVDIVGPVCETGDFLGRERRLPPVRPGDLLYVACCGAYAATMASNYNSRPRAPEVLVDGDGFAVVRRRETVESLWHFELP